MNYLQPFDFEVFLKSFIFPSANLKHETFEPLPVIKGLMHSDRTSDILCSISAHVSVSTAGAFLHSDRERAITSGMYFIDSLKFIRDL